MPMYNAAATVRRAATSILAGTHRDVELVVIDDGSIDGSAQVIESLHDDRIRLHRREHRGIVATLNEGVTLCEHDWIARMDADDLSHPDRLAEQCKVDADIVGSRVRIVDRAGDTVASMQRYERWINAHLTHERISGMRFVESPLVHPSVLARRAVFELGYRDGPLPEDYDLWLRAIQAGHTVAKAHVVLLDWTEDASRLTRRDPRYAPEAFDRCRREHLLGGPLAGVGAVDLWGAGRTGKPWQRWLGDVGLSVRRLYDIDPRKIGERIHGVTVEHPDAMPLADGMPLIIAVGAAGARELIEPHMQERGHVPGRDAWFVA
jgi:hypothetical protein